MFTASLARLEVEASFFFFPWLISKCITAKSLPSLQQGNINTYHPIRLNGEDVRCWARLQPLTPTLFPPLMSVSCSLWLPLYFSAVSPAVFHSLYLTQGRPLCLAAALPLPLQAIVTNTFIVSSQRRRQRLKVSVR